MRLYMKPQNDSEWHKVFKYEPSTGVLVNRVSRGARAQRGGVAGRISNIGYVDVGFGGEKHPAHRIIWEMVNGVIPNGMQIDHVNGVRSDNRLSNLRLVTASGNMRNKKRYTSSTTGVIGVSRHKGAGKYQVRISDAEKVRRHIGLFDTIEEARKAYTDAMEVNGYHVNHGRDS